MVLFIDWSELGISVLGLIGVLLAMAACCIAIVCKFMVAWAVWTDYLAPFFWGAGKKNAPHALWFDANVAPQLEPMARERGLSDREILFLRRTLIHRRREIFATE